MTGDHPCISKFKRDHVTTIEHIPTKYHWNQKRNQVSSISNIPFLRQKQSSRLGGASCVSALRRDDATTIEHITTKFHKILKRSKVSSNGNTSFFWQNQSSRTVGHSCVSAFKGGGTKLISHFAFSDFERTPSPHFTPKIPLNGLKMMGKLFSAKINFQNLTPIFHFLGIPNGPKLFFSENVFA